MSNTTNTIAQLAAGIAGVGMVALSVLPGAAFAQSAGTTTTTTTTTSTMTTAQLQAQIAALLAQIQALQAQLAGTSTSGSGLIAITRDLTIGSRGADVSALQTWLMGQGFSIPAGATGYFGSQTRAAVAAFQAAHGITPAAGYFGPKTRAFIVSMSVTVTPPGGTTGGSTGGTGTTLSGGEATLTNYNLVSEAGDIRPGMTDEKLATAQFDVKNGDINVQRADLEFQATQSGLNTHPWSYLNSISVWDGSKRLATMDVSNQSAWDDSSADSNHNASSAKVYRISLTGLNDVIRQGTNRELRFTANTANTIDTANENQTFRIDVPDQGIRAVDAAGINQYIGSVGDTVTLTVSPALNGKLTISEATSDPNAGVLVADTTNTSSDFNVFAFTARNTQSADTRITDLTFNVATTTGGTATNISNVVRKATLTIGGQTYDGTINSNNTITFNDLNSIVPGNGSLTGTLSFELYGQTGHYSATGEGFTVSLPSTGVTAENANTGDNVGSGNITGTATGNLQTIAVNGGISATGSSANNTTSNAVLTYNSNTPASSFGTFTLSFNVTAVGNDVFIPKAIGVTPNAASTTYDGVVVQGDMITSPSSGTVTASLTTTARSDNANFYVVRAGTTETFTATVTIDPSATGDFQVGLDKIRFSTTDADLNSLQTLDVDQSNAQFHTVPLHIPNA